MPERIFSPDRGAYQEIATLPSGMHCSVLPLLIVHDDQFKVIGTAFVINSAGLLVTARHNIEEVYGDLKNYKGENVGRHMCVSYLAGTQDAPVGGLLNIEQFFMWDHDIIMLRSRVPVPRGTVDVAHSRLISFAVDFAPPVVGERCLALGYDKDNDWQRLGDDELEVVLSLKVSAGFIETTYNNERPYPLFRISAKVEGGLSGGPILNERGEAIGVVSSGMNFLADDGEPVTWGVHSSALLGIKLHHHDGRKEFFYDLVKSGKITTNEYFEQISFTPKDDLCQFKLPI